MKNPLLKLLAAFAGISFIAYLAHGGPPTCSLAITQSGIAQQWQGLVQVTYYDADGHFHSDTLGPVPATLNVPNGAHILAFGSWCDASTSNKIVKCLFTCPPSTNAAVSYLWVPSCNYAGSWTASFSCVPSCQVTITPNAFSACNQNGCSGQ